MTLLIAGLVVFLGIHSISIVAPRWRTAQLQRLGEGPWKGIYTAISIVSLVVLIYGFGQARLDPLVLYSPPKALRHFALLLMVPVFPLLLAAYFPGRIARFAKHPMLVAVKLWALAHLLANGTLADVVLFGAFLVWAVADRISVKRRPPEKRHDPKTVPAGRYNDFIVLFGGLAFYGAFLGGLHLWLIGVSPLG